MRWRWRRAEMPPPGDTRARVGGPAPRWPRYRGGWGGQRGVPPAGPQPSREHPPWDGVNQAFAAPENINKLRVGKGENAAARHKAGVTFPAVVTPAHPGRRAESGGGSGGGSGDSHGATEKPA